MSFIFPRCSYPSEPQMSPLTMKWKRSHWEMMTVLLMTAMVTLRQHKLVLRTVPTRHHPPREVPLHLSQREVRICWIFSMILPLLHLRRLLVLPRVPISPLPLHLLPLPPHHLVQRRYLLSPPRQVKECSSPVSWRREVDRSFLILTLAIHCRLLFKVYRPYKLL
jgi:hypothetical protein